ncbi:bZIP transcription factor 17-like protein [Drosera capensis]
MEKNRVDRIQGRKDLLVLLPTLTQRFPLYVDEALELQLPKSTFYQQAKMHSNRWEVSREMEKALIIQRIAVCSPLWLCRVHGSFLGSSWKWNRARVYTPPFPHTALRHPSPSHSASSPSPSLPSSKPKNQRRGEKKRSKEVSPFPSSSASPPSTMADAAAALAEIPFDPEHDLSFDFSLDSFDFSLDDIHFIDNVLLDNPVVDDPTLDHHHDEGPFIDLESLIGNTDSDVVRVSETDDPIMGCDAIRVSGSSPVVTSPDSGLDKILAEQESSHGSGGGDGDDSGVFQGTNSTTRSGNVNTGDHDVSSAFCFEEKIGEKLVPKRKKEAIEEDEMEEDDVSRVSKVSKSGVVDEEDQRRKARLMRNRESAQLSRQRKKQYVEELEDKVRSMHATITDLNSRISFMMAENATLRQQLTGGAGVCVAPPVPAPHPGMYPMAPVGYPWMPCPPYVVKPQGSQVPLVPIPRLKPQQPAPAPKVSKKSEGKKSEGKTKKVASISLLGFLFFMMLFGGLVPMINVKYGGVGSELGLISGRFDDGHAGKVLRFESHVNGTQGGSGGKFDHVNGHCVGMNCRRLAGTDMEPNKEHLKSGSVDNSSEPLVASLYVPRNDKLVKIDGNLIIHSIMATEKAATEEKKIGEGTSLALARNYGAPYPIPGFGRNNVRHSQMERDGSGRHMALSSGSTDDLRSSPSDGKLQQWFREGLAGPMLSSGMCTEVFQFDVSPAPGAIVPAAGAANSTTTTRQNHQNSTRLNKTRNSRILRGNSMPLNSRTLNVSQEHVIPTSQTDRLPGKESRSSIIVNVLVDPREAGDGDGEGIMGTKALSRIFVVVLIDSVKYVTYSCMLPRVGSGPQLVTA